MPPTREARPPAGWYSGLSTDNAVTGSSFVSRHSVRTHPVAGSPTAQLLGIAAPRPGRP